LRITGGTARGRKLFSPSTKDKDNIRPTSDRVREALFSILGQAVVNATVLDLFAGTGSFGLDALSRGAEEVIFVDTFPRPLQIIQQNLQTCFDMSRAKVLRKNLRNESSYWNLRDHIAPRKQFDIIFLDPPYEKKLAETALTMIEKTGLVTAEGVVIAEERWKITLPEQIDSLHLHLHRRYGETGIWIYKPSASVKVVSPESEREP